MATGTEVLDVGRRDHVVLFYRDEQELTERVSEFLLPAIHDGGVAIVVATPDHRRSFDRYLADAGVDVAAACARGAYLACAHQLDALTEVCHAHTQVTGTPPDAD